MSTFAYKALDPTGSTVQGEIEAEDKVAVASQLRSRGLIVVDIDEQRTGGGDILERFQKVKPDELTVATRQFSTMISSGMSMLRALYVLEEQQENKKLKDAFSQIRKDVEAGLALSDALARHPDIFNELYVAMVAAGETGGILEDTLKRVADQLEKDTSLRRQIKSAMVYPIVIFTFAGIVVIALVAFLVPVFEGVFKDFGGQLPAITQVTVTFSHLITRQPYIIIGAVVARAPTQRSSAPACRCSRRSRSPARRRATSLSRTRCTPCTNRCATVGPLQRRCARSQTRSRAWSCRWSPWARRPVRSTRCCRRSRTSTRTKSRPL
jgi:type IV pilus assembly protein PilC